MGSQADRAVALALIKEVQNQVSKHGEDILLSDPKGNWYRELLKQCEIAESKVPGDKEVLLSSTLTKINLELAMGGAVVPLYDKALELVGSGTKMEATIRHKYGVYLRANFSDKGRLDKDIKQKAVENFERAIELYGANTPEGIKSATELEKVKAMQSATGGGGCFIASAAYGSSFTPEVIVFRRFRDEVLLTSKLGTIFVEFYYLTSPPLARLISKAKFLQAATRWLLLGPVLRLLKNSSRF